MMAEVAIPQEILDATENEVSENSKSSNQMIPTLNEDEILKANALFAETCSVSIKGLIKIIPFKLNNNDITLKVNDSQDMIIGDLRIKWHLFLKNHFKSPDLSLLFEIDNSIEHKKIAYTAPEQLKEMLEDNEKLQYLVDKFKLKIKY
jgi:hypothetical protein